MRITASQLRKIIKEEISRMNESRDRGTMWDPDPQAQAYKQPSIEDFGGSDTWQEAEREVEDPVRVPPGLVNDAARMFIQVKEQTHGSLRRAMSEYMGGVLSDGTELGMDQINTDEIAFAIGQIARSEGWGKKYLNPAVLEGAAEAVANAYYRRSRRY